MNERIRELAEQAGYCSDVYEICKPGMEKFAELIIKECAQSLWTDECHVSDLAVEEFNSNKEEFGEKQVLSIIKAYSDKDLKELFAVIMENLNSFLANASRQDDITFIGIEHDYDK